MPNFTNIPFAQNIISSLPQEPQDDINEDKSTFSALVNQNIIGLKFLRGNGIEWNYKTEVYTADEANRVMDIRNIPIEKRAKLIENSNSLKELEDRSQAVKSNEEELQIIANMGVSGIAASLGISLLDPIALAATVATGGLSRIAWGAKVAKSVANGSNTLRHIDNAVQAGSVSLGSTYMLEKTLGEDLTTQQASISAGAGLILGYAGSRFFGKNVIKNNEEISKIAVEMGSSPTAPFNANTNFTVENPMPKQSYFVEWMHGDGARLQGSDNPLVREDGYKGVPSMGNSGVQTMDTAQDIKDALKVITTDTNDDINAHIGAFEEKNGVKFDVDIDGREVNRIGHQLEFDYSRTKKLEIENINEANKNSLKKELDDVAKSETEAFDIPERKKLTKIEEAEEIKNKKMKDDYDTVFNTINEELKKNITDPKVKIILKNKITTLEKEIVDDKIILKRKGNLKNTLKKSTYHVNTIQREITKIETSVKKLDKEVINIEARKNNKRSKITEKDVVRVKERVKKEKIKYEAELNSKKKKLEVETKRNEKITRVISPDNIKNKIIKNNETIKEIKLKLKNSNNDAKVKKLEIKKKKLEKEYKLKTTKSKIAIEKANKNLKKNLKKNKKLQEKIKTKQKEITDKYDLETNKKAIETASKQHTENLKNIDKKYKPFIDAITSHNKKFGDIIKKNDLDGLKDMDGNAYWTRLYSTAKIANDVDGAIRAFANGMRDNFKDISPELDAEILEGAKNVVESILAQKNLYNAIDAGKHFITKEMGKLNYTPKQLKGRQLKVNAAHIVDFVDNDIFNNITGYGHNMSGKIAAKKLYGIDKNTPVKDYLLGRGKVGDSDYLPNRKYKPKETKQFGHMIESIYGTRGIDPRANSLFSRVVGSVNNFLYGTFGGFFGANSLADIGAVVNDFGFVRTMKYANKDIVKPFLSNTDNSNKLARSLGFAAEGMYGERTAMFASSNYGLDRFNKVEIGLQKYGHFTSKLSGMNVVIDFLDRTVAVTALDYILTKGIDKKFIKNMNRLGLTMDDVNLLRAKKDSFVKFEKGFISKINRENLDTKSLAVLERGLRRAVNDTIMKGSELEIPSFLVDIIGSHALSKTLFLFMKYPVLAYNKMSRKMIHNFDAIDAAAATATSAFILGTVTQIQDIGKEKPRYDLNTKQGQLNFTMRIIDMMPHTAGLSLANQYTGILEHAYNLTTDEPMKTHRYNPLTPFGISAQVANRTVKSVRNAMSGKANTNDILFAKSLAMPNMLWIQPFNNMANDYLRDGLE